MTELSTASGLSEELIKQIAEVAQHFGCRKVILYGSRATGRFTATSDIDLAVDCEGEIGPLEVYLSELDTLLKFDVVHLNRAAEPLLSEVLKNGKVIYEKI